MGRELHDPLSSYCVLLVVVVLKLKLIRWLPLTKPSQKLRSTGEDSTYSATGLQAPGGRDYFGTIEATRVWV